MPCPLAVRRQRRDAHLALSGVRPPGRESARTFAQVIRVRRSRHGAPCRDVVCAFAIGDAPPRLWHADGAMLDWDDAPDDLREAFERGMTIAAWNASFDSARLELRTLGSPFLEPERVIDPMIQAGVSQSADRSRKRLALPRRRGQAEGRQEADPAVLRRGRGAGRASRGMAALPRLRAPGRRGDARRLSAHAAAAARGMAAILGFRAHQSARRRRRRAVRRARRGARGRGRRRQRPPARRVDGRRRDQGHAGEAARVLALRSAPRRDDARRADDRRARRGRR